MPLEEKIKFEERLKTDQSFYKEFKRYIYLISSLRKAARKENNMFGRAFQKMTKEQLLHIIQPSYSKSNEEYTNSGVSSSLFNEKYVEENYEINAREIKVRASKVSSRTYKKEEQEPGSFKIKSITIYTTSIAAVFVICFWGFNSYYNKMQKYNDLYSSNFNVLSNDYLDTASRGGEILSEKDSVSFELAKQYYANSDYEKALKQIEILKDKQAIMQATCLLKLNRTDEAVKLLEKEYKNSKNGEAGWYLALAYIRDHKKESAIQVLKELENSGTNISEKAKKLRLELEKE